MAHFNLGDLKALVYARLENNQAMYQPSEVTWAINEAIACANLVCAWAQDTSTISGGTVPDRHIYDVPSNIIFPIRVTFAGQVLEKTALSTMANTIPSFYRDTSNTTGLQVSRWVPLGIGKFAIHPADSIGGAELKVTGISEFYRLTLDTDETWMPKEGVTAVCDYAAHIVQCKLQGTPFMQSLAFFNNYKTLMGLNKYWKSYTQPDLVIDTKSPTELN